MMNLYYHGSLTPIFINSFYLGAFSPEQKSPEALLEGFRNTPIETLRERLQILMIINSTQDKYTSKYKTDELVGSLLKSVHDSLTESDIIKLIYIQPVFYNTEDFSRVFKHDKAEASKVYSWYLQNTDRPLDFELYHEPMMINLSYKHILACLHDRDIERLRSMLRCTKLKTLKIHHHDCEEWRNCWKHNEDENVQQMFQLILQAGIKIVPTVGHYWDECAGKILQRAKASMPTLIKSADTWRYQKR
jgi:hypothetical protein